MEGDKGNSGNSGNSGERRIKSIDGEVAAHDGVAGALLLAGHVLEPLHEPDHQPRKGQRAKVRAEGVSYRPFDPVVVGLTVPIPWGWGEEEGGRGG